MDYEKAKRTAEALVSKMTPYEKLSQLLYKSPAINRLNIKEHTWWNEAAHGVARAGVATVFPQVIGMAATFNPELIGEVANAVSTEARAKYNKNLEFEDYGMNKCLTFWAPNINIFRDTRWGRGQETFGEDPFLTATMGKSYIKGLQGEGEFLKAAACAKHFAVHSGPERVRHGQDVKIGNKDLYETYLPAFEHAVGSGVAGVMGAYNRVNGEPCCAHSVLMQDILFDKWGFKGYYVSDCGAILDISEHHHYTDTIKDAAAVSLNRGCHLNCGEAYEHLIDAYEEDLLSDEAIDTAVTRLFTIRAALGEFEEQRPFSDIPYSMLDCKEHKELNLKTAEQSMVLLKNEILPLESSPKKIAVVGPNAMSTVALEGNYNGVASQYVTIADGIRQKFTDSDIMVAMGSDLYAKVKTAVAGLDSLLTEGKSAASEADLTVLCLGLDRCIEGEETDTEDSDFTDSGDKTGLSLPPAQIKLAEAVCDLCDNVIVVVLCGSPLDLGEKVNEKAKAIIYGWYPGSLGGLAVARLIKGDFSPSGKLPLTFYKADTELPPFEEYAMANRTYRYFEGKPLYPFGFGLSYADIRYDKAEVVSKSDNKITLDVTLSNLSDIFTDEKIQVYAKFTDSRTKTPNFQLCAVKAVELNANATIATTLEIDSYWLKAVLEDGSRVEPDGDVKLYVGSHQPDERSNELSKHPCIEINL